MPALSHAFSRANGLDSEFFLQVLVTSIVTNHKQKNPSVGRPIYIALSKCRSHQLMRPDKSKQSSLPAVLYTHLRICVCISTSFVRNRPGL